MWPAVKSRISPFSTCDEVAADRPVVGAEGNAHGGGFERRPAGVDGEGVVAEEAERGHVAGRRQRPRHVVGAADDAGLGDAVHVRLAGRLQRRLAAEGVLRFVGAAVGDDDDVLHAGNLADSAVAGHYRLSCSLARRQCS